RTCGVNIAEPSHVASRSSEAGHKAGADGIARYRKHNRDCPDRTAGRVRGLRSLRHSGVHPRVRQFRGERRKAVGVSAGPPELEGEVPPFGVTTLSETLPKRFDARVARGRRSGSQGAYTPDLGRVL